MAEEQCELFLLLHRCEAPGKPAGEPRQQLRVPFRSQVADSRFLIGATEVGEWVRNRLEEFEDLHRIELEGLGRIQEWRDASAVVLVAKWRALAQIACSAGFYEALAAHLKGLLARNSLESRV